MNITKEQNSLDCQQTSDLIEIELTVGEGEWEFEYRGTRERGDQLRSTIAQENRSRKNWHKESTNFHLVCLVSHTSLLEFRRKRRKKQLMKSTVRLSTRSKAWSTSSLVERPSMLKLSRAKRYTSFGILTIPRARRESTGIC